MGEATERRAYNTAWARQKRQQAIATKNAKATTCRAMLANRLPCKTPLQSRFVDGETVPFCPTCDRKARGVCIDCGAAPVVGTPGKGLRCLLHQRMAKQAATTRHRQTHPRREARTKRTRIQDPQKHAAILEYKRLYRQARQAKVREYKRASYQRHREKYLAYHRAYREARKVALAEWRIARQRGELPPRHCVSCPTIVTGRVKKCDACKAAHRVAAREAIAQRLARAAHGVAV